MQLMKMFLLNHIIKSRTHDETLTHSIKSRSRLKKDSTKRHNHRHHQQKPGEQQFLIRVVTGQSYI